MTSFQEVGLAVKRLQWRHHREANQQMAPLGLSLVQWDVLRHLAAHPGASLHELAGLTFQTDQSMGELAARMVDRGLLERIAGPGRKVQHQLTKTGNEARIAGGTLIDEVLARSLGGLTAGELTRLHELLAKAAIAAG